MLGEHLKDKIPLNALLIFLAFMMGALFAIAFIDNSTNQFDFIRDPESLSSCLSSAPGGQAEGDPVAYCYSKIYKQSMLEEFQLRRIVFQTQYVSDVALLWMVIFITTSGVILSGIQLYTSYQISLSGRISGGGQVGDQSLEIERGKLSLKSSVTGLFILVFSLAFFYLYIIFVYTIKDPSRETGRDQVGRYDEAVGVAGEFFNGQTGLNPTAPPNSAPSTQERGPGTAATSPGRNTN